jgi:hypothetical protein
MFEQTCQCAAQDVSSSSLWRGTFVTSRGNPYLGSSSGLYGLLYAILVVSSRLRVYRNADSSDAIGWPSLSMSQQKMASRPSRRVILEVGFGLTFVFGLWGIRPC